MRSEVPIAQAINDAKLFFENDKNNPWVKWVFDCYLCHKTYRGRGAMNHKKSIKRDNHLKAVYCSGLKKKKTYDYSYRSKDVLRAHYPEFSIKDIAKKFGTDEATILSWIQYHGLHLVRRRVDPIEDQKYEWKAKGMGIGNRKGCKGNKK